MRTLGNLRAARAGDLVPIPAFDKTRDDRVPESEWTSHRGPVEVVCSKAGAWAHVLNRRTHWLRR